MESLANLELSTEYPSGEEFARHVGSVFRALAEDGAGVELELAEVEILPGQRHGSGQDQAGSAFSLIFQGPATAILRQRTYAMQHPGIGTLGIFIVPLGPHPQSKQMRYQAIFN